MVFISNRRKNDHDSARRHNDYREQMIQLKAHDPVACSHHGEVDGVGEQETTGISGGVISAGKKPQEEEHAEKYKS